MKHVEINITVFTVIDREVKLLLLKKQTEPYKGYWLIPNIQASHQIPIAESVNQILAKLNLPTVKVLQHKTYSDFEKETSTNTIIISYIGIVDSIRGRENQGESVFEQEWFNIHKIPKMAYNYEMIIGNNIVYLKELIKKGSVLNFLFPGDFTLPELQKVIEE